MTSNNEASAQPALGPTLRKNRAGIVAKMKQKANGLKLSGIRSV